MRNYCFCKKIIFITILFFLSLCTSLSAYDLNKDGYDDIIFSNYTNGSTTNINSYIYWGDSSNTYSTKTELATHGAFGGNTVADLNSDGHLDIIFSNFSNGTTNNINSYIYWGDSSNTYSSKTELATKGSFSCSVGDLNKDGYLDLVFSNAYDGTSYNVNSYIYWGDFSNTYSSKTELATHGALANSINDINGDGHLDIVFSNFNNDTSNNINSYIYWGDDSASYLTKTELATQGAVGNSVADLNGDGYKDIVFSNYNNGITHNINSYIYWGDSAYTFSTKTELATHAAYANSIADLDNDGHLDIVFSNYFDDTSYNINSYIYWGAGSYSSKTELATKGAIGNTIADLDNDGHLDILFSNYYDGTSFNIDSYIYWGDQSAPYSTKTELATHGARGVTAGSMSAFSNNTPPIPEPLSIILIGLGIIGLIRKKKSD